MDRNRADTGTTIQDKPLAGRTLRGTASRKRVDVIALGGTIAMTGAADGGIEPTLSGESLIRSVPSIAKIADIVVHSPFTMPGASLSVVHMREVADLTRQVLGSDTDGVVIVQGTDTIEETAFVLDRLITSAKPIVLTGAMRGPEAAGADGPANLLGATIVAASAARDTGVLVVMNDEVHAARFVRKGHTGITSSFASGPHGPIGYVLEGQFQRMLLLPELPRIELKPTATIEPVALFHIGLGDDGQLIQSAAGLNYSGAIVAAMGAGHVPANLVKPLSILAEQVPVVLSTRVTGGPVFRSTYGFAGSEMDLLERGLIAGGSIGPLKARLLLQLALAAGIRGRSELKDLFLRF